MALLDDVKNYLDITWDMTWEEEQKLRGMVARAEAALAGKIGRCSFEEETPEKTLLMNCVMYDRAGHWRISGSITAGKSFPCG